ncbi:MAG: hypothetical protein WC510_03640 [Candidatus Omnitrophota bacterium]
MVVHNNKSGGSFVFLSNSGCLLPLLIFLNLLFGWIFLKTSYWLLLEAVLVILFVVTSYKISRKVFSSYKKQDKIIDVEAEVIKDNKAKLN